jgi:hypothetical protein
MNADRHRSRDWAADPEETATAVKLPLAGKPVTGYGAYLITKSSDKGGKLAFIKIQESVKVARSRLKNFFWGSCMHLLGGVQVSCLAIIHVNIIAQIFYLLGLGFEIWMFQSCG